MSGAATCAPLLLQALLSGSVSSETATKLRTLYTTSSVRVVSLAIPIRDTDLCFTSNLLDVAPLRTSVIPMHGSAAGSTILASEAATFRLDRPRAPQDLQRLNLRYGVASFMCVPIPTYPQRRVATPAKERCEPGGNVPPAPVQHKNIQQQQQQRLPLASEQNALMESVDPSGTADAGGCVMATTPGDGPAAGSLTLGFLDDERQDLLSPLMAAFSLAAALAPLLQEVAVAMTALQFAPHSGAGGSPGASSQTTAAAIHCWRADADAAASEGDSALAAPGSRTDSDSATAPEVAQLLRHRDMRAWLYDSPWGSFSSLSCMEDDALPPQRTHHQHEAWAETRPPQHNDIAAGAAGSAAKPSRMPAAAAAHGPAEGQATPPATPPGSPHMLSAPPSAACSEAATQLAAAGSDESAGSTSAALVDTVCAHR